MNCKICGKVINTYQGLAKHLNTIHKMNPKVYYDKYIRPPNVGICICGKETPFLSLSKGYQKHCCASCAQKDPNVNNTFIKANPQKDTKIKNKTINTCIEKYGGKGYGSHYIQTKSKITRFNNKYKGGKLLYECSETG